MDKTEHIIKHKPYNEAGSSPSEVSKREVGLLIEEISQQDSLYPHKSEEAINRVKNATHTLRLFLETPSCKNSDEYSAD